MICRGGPLDGEELKGTNGIAGMYVLFPLVDDEYTADSIAWLAQYGTAHAWAMAGGEEWTGPPEPTFPKARYLCQPDGDCVFQGIER